MKSNTINILSLRLTKSCKISLHKKVNISIPAAPVPGPLVKKRRRDENNMAVVVEQIKEVLQKKLMTMIRTMMMVMVMMVMVTMTMVMVIIR